MDVMLKLCGCRLSRPAPQALEILHLNHLRPTLVVIGGAGLMTEESLQRLQTIFNDVLAPLAIDMNLTVLDGGTDSGVIQMMGRARHASGGQFPLIGVVPQGKAQLPNFQEVRDDESRHALEPHHTSFFLIPGDEWGCESRWLADFASLISSGQKSLTVLINGGKIALTDLQANLAEGRPAIVMSGSGRLADTYYRRYDRFSPPRMSILKLLSWSTPMSPRVS